MAELQQDRTGGRPPSRRPGREEVEPTGHVAVGFTDRAELDGFIGGEAGNLVIHGPIRTGERVREAATIGPGATEGTPCLVVPLVHERIDEIQREVSAVLSRFRTRGTSSGAIREGGDGERGR